MQNGIEKEITVLSLETGIAVTSLYNQQVFTESDLLGDYKYILYNGVKVPLQTSSCSPIPYVFIKYGKIQEHDRRVYAISAKQVLDYEQLRQLSNGTKVYIIGIDSTYGNYHCYDVQWVKEDTLGYSNVLYVTEHFYGRTTYNKIVLGSSTLQERLPLLADMLYSGTVYQVEKEGDLYTTFFHPNTTKLEVHHAI